MFNDIETFKQNLKFQFTLKHLNKTLISNKGNNKITEHRAIFQRERQNSYVNKQIKSVNNQRTWKTAMAPIW